MKYGLILVCLCASTVYGQQYAPGSTGIVNQNVVQSPMVPVQPPCVNPGPAPNMIPPEWLQNGYREEFKQTHDIYPFREYNYPGQPMINQQAVVYGQQQPQWYGQQGYGYQQQYPGWVWNGTNWQRDCQYQQPCYQQQQCCPQRCCQPCYQQQQHWYGW